MSWEAAAAASGRFVEAWAIRLLFCLVVGLFMWRLATWARMAFERATRRTAADVNVQLVAGRLVYGAVLVLGLVWILGIIGIEQASILATFGAVGLALSLAVQDILKSFFAGLYLLFERPFLIGDEVQIKDYVGRVETVGFRATSLRTAENVLVVVPNSMVFAEIVSNRSGRVVTTPPASEQPGDAKGPDSTEAVGRP
jgi:small conductance mechanosensitive channel